MRSVCAAQLQKQCIYRTIEIIQGQKPIAQIIQGQPRCLEALRERVKNRREVVFARQAVVARDAVACSPQFFAVLQARRTAVLRAVADVTGKNSGQKERLVANVRTDEETGVIIGG